MVEIRLDHAEIESLVSDIVARTCAELDRVKGHGHGKLALSEPEAAKLIGLNVWQLRDLRLAGKIGHTRIVGNKVRYLLEDIHSYLRRRHQRGTD